MSRVMQTGDWMTIVFSANYGLGSIPSGTGRLYCQDVARGATNRSRGSEAQDLQPTGARASPHVCSTRGSQQSRRNRRDSTPSLGVELRRRTVLAQEPGFSG